jgi:hypothetical protein
MIDALPQALHRHSCEWLRDARHRVRWDLVFEAITRTEFYNVRSILRAQIAHDTLNESADGSRTNGQ